MFSNQTSLLLNQNLEVLVADQIAASLLEINSISPVLVHSDGYYKAVWHVQLIHQVIGLDSVPDAKFIKIKKRGRPLKDLIPKKKKQQPQTKEESTQEVLNNSFPIITITMLNSKATAICWHFKITDIQLKFLNFNTVFNSTFIIFLLHMRSSQVLFLILLFTFRWLKGCNNTESTDTFEETA